MLCNYHPDDFLSRALSGEKREKDLRAEFVKWNLFREQMGNVDKGGASGRGRHRTTGMPTVEHVISFPTDTTRITFFRSPRTGNFTPSNRER
jgi:hypothetical protein